MIYNRERKSQQNTYFSGNGGGGLWWKNCVRLHTITFLTLVLHMIWKSGSRTKLLRSRSSITVAVDSIFLICLFSSVSFVAVWVREMHFYSFIGQFIDEKHVFKLCKSGNNIAYTTANNCCIIYIYISACNNVYMLKNANGYFGHLEW